MTTRRRRKTGSGPSATALIAWAGGARGFIEAPAGGPVSGIHGEPAGGIPGGRAVFVGRACGLAAGTLLAFGSVLAGAANVGDGSLAEETAALPDPQPAPSVGSGGSDESPARVPVEPALAAPVPVSTQAVTGTTPAGQSRLGPVRRNTPVSLGVPAEPSRHARAEQQPSGSRAPAADQSPGSPTAPVDPVLDPAASEVDRVAPVGGVLKPKNPRGGQKSNAGVRDEQPSGSGVRDERASRVRDERTTRSTIPAVKPVQRVVAPLDNATRPARAKLGGLLP